MDQKHHLQNRFLIYSSFQGRNNLGPTLFCSVVGVVSSSQNRRVTNERSRGKIVNAQYGDRTLLEYWIVLEKLTESVVSRVMEESAVGDE